MPTSLTHLDVKRWEIQVKPLCKVEARPNLADWFLSDPVERIASLQRSLQPGPQPIRSAESGPQPIRPV